MAMKKLVVLATFLLVYAAVPAQEKSNWSKQAGKAGNKGALPGLQTCLRTAQHNLRLFTEGQPNDVNSIVKEIELYIDSMPKNKTTADALLSKNFAPLRHFFLTTTNKTTVAAEFLYTVAPYNFGMYNDTALGLYLWAVKDGEPYNLGKMTDKRVLKLALGNCLLPSLAALDEFKEGELKYVALSVYYGCKDTREGAPKTGTVPYCLTLIARLGDIQQYAAGLITDKGLLANAEVYLADEDDMRRVNVD